MPMIDAANHALPRSTWPCLGILALLLFLTAPVAHGAPTSQVFGLERPREVDVLLLANGKKLQGKVVNFTLSVKTAYGVVTAPSMLCAGLAFEDSGESTLVTTDGSRVSGEIFPDLIKFRLRASGEILDVSRRMIRHILFADDEGESAPSADAAPLVITLRNGDRLVGRLPSRALRLNPLQGTEPETINLADIRELHAGYDGNVDITSSDGRVLVGKPEPTTIDVLLDFGETLRDLAFHDITAIGSNVSPLEAVEQAAPAPSMVPSAAPIPEQVVREATLAETPTPANGSIWVEPITGMEFVHVPGGCFRMGDDSGSGDADERPAREVCVDSFWLGRHEVTQKQWTKVMGSNPSHFRGGKRPVERVSWREAQDFLKRLGEQSGASFRLPTEAEWEYAARDGGRDERYAGGSEPDRVAWSEGNSDKTTHPVGLLAPNGLGLFDMSGNVWEWCQDVYAADAYARSGRDNPLVGDAGDERSPRVRRGGSWYSHAVDARCANRYEGDPNQASGNVGFRVLRLP